MPEPAAALANRDARLLAAARSAALMGRRRRTARTLALQLLLCAAVLALWQYASGRWVDALFFSDPVRIATALVRITLNGYLWWQLQVTLLELVLGYVAGVVMGIAAAILVSVIPYGEPIARPTMLAAFATPKVALAPIIIIWFGIGLLPKVVLAAALVFFIVYFNTLAGIAATQPGMVAVLRVMGASRTAIIRKVVVPRALPNIFIAMRITLPAALIGAIIGEFVSSNRGIGYLIAAASSRYNTAEVFAGILSLLVFVLLLNSLIGGLERRLLRWRPAA